MIILIKTECNCSRDFMWCVRRFLHRALISNINTDKIEAYSNYISEISKKDVDCYLAIRKMLSCFRVVCFKDNLYFSIPDTVKYPMTDIKLSTIIKIMEYGTVDIKPYPMIRKSIKILLNNFNYYYNMYMNYGVIV